MVSAMSSHCAIAGDTVMCLYCCMHTSAGPQCAAILGGPWSPVTHYSAITVV